MMEKRVRDRLQIETRYYLSPILTKENMDGLEKVAAIGKVSSKEALNKIVASKLKEYVEKGILPPI